MPRGQNFELLKLLYQNQMATGDPFSSASPADTDYQPYDENQSDLASVGQTMAPPEEQPPAPKPEATRPEAPTGEAEAPKFSVGKTRLPAYSGGKAFVEGMVKRGWTPEEAAGAAGNVHVESGFRPGIKSSVKNEQSFGFLQWNHERLEGLKNYAAQNRKDWQDPETQMDYIHMERTGDSIKYGGSDERTAYRRALAGGGSPSEIAARFGRYVERPKDLSQSVQIRQAAAEQYAGMAQSGADEFTQIVRSM
jgi:Phage tail lysozyme